MYEIQKGFPIPPVDHSPRKKRTKYPFEEMEIDDMIFVPEKKTSSIATHVSQVAKKLGRKFSVRQTLAKREGGKWVPATHGEKGATNGVGVWRMT